MTAPDPRWEALRRAAQALVSGYWSPACDYEVEEYSLVAGVRAALAALEEPATLVPCVTCGTHVSKHNVSTHCAPPEAPDREALVAEVAALRAERARALEEAARVVDGWEGTRVSPRFIAGNVRALIASPPPAPAAPSEEAVAFEGHPRGVCWECGGSGLLRRRYVGPKPPCPVCNGTGRAPRAEEGDKP